MVVNLAYYLTEFMPIAAGLIFLLIIKSASLYKNKVRIDTESDLRAVYNTDCVGINNQEKTEFKKIQTDIVIVNGKNPVKIEDIDEYAAKNLGLVDIKDKKLDKRLLNIKNGKLLLFAPTRYDFLEKFLSFNSVPGTILAYAISDRLFLIDKYGHN